MKHLDFCKHRRVTVADDSKRAQAPGAPSHSVHRGARTTTPGRTGALVSRHCSPTKWSQDSWEKQLILALGQRKDKTGLGQITALEWHQLRGK